MSFVLEFFLEWVVTIAAWAAVWTVQPIGWVVVLGGLIFVKRHQWVYCFVCAVLATLMWPFIMQGDAGIEPFWPVLLVVVTSTWRLLIQILSAIRAHLQERRLAQEARGARPS